MANTLRTKETRDVQSTGNTSASDHTEASACRRGMLACCMGKKSLKGLVLMAACCGAPVLLVLALPVVGSALVTGWASLLHATPITVKTPVTSAIAVPVMYLTAIAPWGANFAFHEY